MTGAADRQGRPARLAGPSSPDAPRGPLPQAEFDWIFSRVPRLTAELAIAEPSRGFLLLLRDRGPCQGLWHLPGGTVRFGERVIDAARRVGRDELGLTVDVRELLGYIEYPSHYENGLDSPVGLAFRAVLPAQAATPAGCRWFETLPDLMHAEQRDFLTEHASALLRRAQPDTAA